MSLTPYPPVAGPGLLDLAKQELYNAISFLNYRLERESHPPAFHVHDFLNLVKDKTDAALNAHIFILEEKISDASRSPLSHLISVLPRDHQAEIKAEIRRLPYVSSLRNRYARVNMHLLTMIFNGVANWYDDKHVLKGR